jgi:hypothetical protein
MYWFILFSLLYIVKKYISGNPRLGIDERCVIYNDIISYDNVTNTKMLKIYETNEKIKFLESTNVSLDDKLYELENRNVPEIMHLVNGGLFNDWNFNFVEHI